MKLSDWIVVYGIIAAGVYSILGWIAQFMNSKYQYHLQKRLAQELAAEAAGTPKPPQSKKRNAVVRLLTTPSFQFTVFGLAIANLTFLCSRPGPLTKPLILEIIFATAGIIVQWITINDRMTTEIIVNILHTQDSMMKAQVSMASTQASIINTLDTLNTISEKSTDISNHVAQGFDSLMDNPRLKEIIEPERAPQHGERPKARRGKAPANVDKSADNHVDNS